MNNAISIGSLCMSCKKKQWTIEKDNVGFYKLCPRCESRIYYTTSEGVKYSVKNKIICKNCKIKPSAEYIRNCTKCNKQLKTKNKYFFLKSESNKSRCLSCCNTGRKFSENARKNMSDNHADFNGSKNPFYKKSHSDETKNKISNSIGVSERLNRRNRCLSRIEKYGKIVSFNSEACEYFNNLNEERGWNLIHAMNGGEFKVMGYSLDSYDKYNNIAVEYDEPKHYKDGCLRESDVIRQNRIIKNLQCKFFRYNESQCKLYEAFYEEDIKN